MLVAGFDDLGIRHLRALQAIAGEGTFAGAARRLGYTQSAISQQIGALEAAVGGAVFDRPGGPRRAVLTPLGDRLLGHAGGILDRLDAARSDLEEFLAGRVGTLTVGTFQSVSVQVLPLVLSRLRVERPDLQVRPVESVNEWDLVDGLRSRRLDVAFLMVPELGGDEIESIPLLDDPFVLVSPHTGDPAEPAGAAIDPVELRGVPMVSERSRWCEELIERPLRQRVPDLDVVFRTQDNAAVQAMVRSGLGHAVTASLAVDPQDRGVRVHALDPPLPPRRISVGYLRDRHQSPALDHFLSLAREVAAELIDRSPWLTAPAS